MVFVPQRNRLLAQLPPGELEHIQPRLESVHLARGTVLPESQVLFPLAGLVALSPVSDDQIANGLVGIDGFVGVPVLTGQRGWLRARVLVPGEAVRVPPELLAATADGVLPALALPFVASLVEQIGRTAVCNRRHGVFQQLCRWLLLAFDRIGDDTLPLTHEAIANLLGVRREGVTEAAIKLQAAGAIRYSRGRIRLCDRAGLAAQSCECYVDPRVAFARGSGWSTTPPEAPARLRERVAG